MVPRRRQMGPVVIGLNIGLNFYMSCGEVDVVTLTATLTDST